MKRVTSIERGLFAAEPQEYRQIEYEQLPVNPFYAWRKPLATGPAGWCCA